MSEKKDHFPARVEPYVIMGSLDERIPVHRGPFRIVGPTSGLLESDLEFAWRPCSRVEFEGEVDSPGLDINASWSLTKAGQPSFRVPVLLTRCAYGQSSTQVRGFVDGRLDLGQGPMERVRFALANFPAYLGSPVRSEHSVFSGRLEIDSEFGRVSVDLVPEVEKLLSSTSTEPGFVVSHTGCWTPITNEVSVEEVESAFELLRVWFGFLRGAWCGPLFPEGLAGESVVWRQFAPWRLDENRPVPSWLPTHHRLELSKAFRGFLSHWRDPVWQEPLKLAISWLAEANSSRSGPEAKVILGQVAVDLLAWVKMVESIGAYTAADFDALRAKERARKALSYLNIPADVPDYLPDLQSLSAQLGTDGPGTISRIRNQLVHPTGKNRAKVGALTKEQLFECGQLGLQYVELILLALCSYDGRYACRGIHGWKGDDEMLVPWAESG